MVTEKEISRELMGKIVDEVFDGAIEDASVIEEIYACIKRHEAALSTDSEPVAWLVKRSNFDGVLFDTELSFVRPTISKTCKTEMVPLYTAPPAPSVAVKAIAPADVYKALKPWVNTGAIDRDYVSAISRSVASALSAQVQDEADLDTRMKAAGMYTIAEMMGVNPLTRWKSNPAINTIAAFSEWLDRKVSEYLSMKSGYDLGDKSEDDELYEWVLAHAGVFSTIRDQFHVVTAAPAAKLEEKP